MPHCKVRELMFAGMTPSVRFSDITDSNQSPICSIFFSELPTYIWSQSFEFFEWYAEQ